MPYTFGMLRYSTPAPKSYLFPKESDMDDLVLWQSLSLLFFWLAIMRKNKAFILAMARF